MSMNDPLADMLTRIRNGSMVKKVTVDMPFSKVKAGLAEILKDEGYVTGYEVIKDDKQGVLRIELKYDQNGNGVITGLRRVSSPGCRVYVKSDKIPKVMSGLGIGVITTSHGIMSDRQARAKGVGGEFLCEVW